MAGRRCASSGWGEVPRQIFHEDNRVAHVIEYEGQPGRRPLTYDDRLDTS